MLLGPRRSRVPITTWIRSSALAYAMMILVPAGRAAGEVARATLIARHVGAPAAATASTQLQAAYVFAIGLLSTVDCAVVAGSLGVRSPLTLLLAANAAFMLTIAATLLALLWHARVGAWLDRLRRRFIRLPQDEVPVEPSRRRAIPWRAAAICSLSRTAQVIQYGVILRAVGGTSSVRGMLVAHGIHLVGTTLGDVLPNGLGIVDGTYRTFAAAVGFGDSPAQALSIAFLAHMAQLIVATASIVVLGISGRAPANDAAAPTSAGADA
jgi:uncharacterized membrane protein YbhN (UPF0104 family)